MARTSRVPRPDGVAGDAANGGVLGHQPELLRLFQRLYGTLWSHGVVDAATKEVVRLRNARTTGCNYCRNVRFAGARDGGLDEGRVDLIAQGFEASALSDRHKTAIRWTDAFLQDPAGTSAALRTEMLGHFTPEEIVELTLGAALFMGFSKIAIVLGQEPETMPTTVIPTPTRPT
ncbi:MAG TPA: carboxymuconolactone decarboxylase family protein [Candidatus Binatia bacterium]|jgi:AhpD family alkylhydroperoxidase|nr:carboxymuconolactone decarboxylase family protein [Candidatus Binatia bacterium]